MLRSRAPVLLLALTLAASPAFADGRIDARGHYERGTSLFDLGKYHDAAHEYEQAYELKNDPALLFNIGQAYRLANEHEQAIIAYRSYLRRSPDAPNRVEVASRISELQQILDREKRAATSPPMGVLKPGQAPEPTPATREGSTATPPPAEAPPPSVPPTTGETSTAPAPAPAEAMPSAVVTAHPSEKTPVYKKWWFWTAIGGVVVAGVVVGVAVAATTPQNANAPAGAYTVSF